MANWASVDRLGNPASADWQAQNLTWIEPVKGQRWQVYKPAEQAFNGFLGDLAATGYPLESSGGFNYRNIRGGDKLSQHAFGTALDLNAATNPRLNPGDKVRTDLPSNVGELAKKWGLEWGGNWKRPDAMHFEYTGGAASGEQPGIAQVQNKTFDPVSDVLAAGGNAPAGYTPQAQAVAGSTGTPETAAAAPAATADASKGLLGIDVPGLTGNKNLGGLLAFSQMAMAQPQVADDTPRGGLLASQPVQINPMTSAKQTFKPWEMSMFRGRA